MGRNEEYVKNGSTWCSAPREQVPGINPQTSANNNPHIYNWAAVAYPH